MLLEPQDLIIPNEGDFYYDGDVDERWAIDHYLGKDISFAEERYYSLCPLSMVHDFTLVGARAFRYYIFGAFRYLQDPRSINEQDVYASLPEIISKKIYEEPSAFTPVKDYLINFCGWAVDNYQKFDIDPYVDIYGDVCERYKNLSLVVMEKVPQ
ncbi:hypothetical protein [Reinekea sp. G2M2-21]|uniref:hypothetical protein n=1 Tax=Reinekea sp. G2M2-21 TaxID=2788942 RepID=UPI0018AA4931|nr:hypothetical protein [Reinekea sp. G2M2-21]